MLTLFPTERTDRPRRTRGRPRASQTIRDRLLLCGSLRYRAGRTVEQVATLMGVEPRTVYRWTALALDLDGPDGDALRTLASGRRRLVS